MTKQNTILQTLFVALFVGTSLSVSAQTRNFDDVEIKPHKITDNLYMLEGAGGNIGIFFGEDGALMIDDQFAPLSEKITAAIGEITSEEIRFLINTHVHDDHVVAMNILQIWALLLLPMTMFVIACQKGL